MRPVPGRCPVACTKRWPLFWRKSVQEFSRRTGHSAIALATAGGRKCPAAIPRSLAIQILAQEGERGAMGLFHLVPVSSVQPVLGPWNADKAVLDAVPFQLARQQLRLLVRH